MKKTTQIELIGFTLDEIDELRKKDSDYIQISNVIMRNAREIYEILEVKPVMYPCIRDAIQFEWEIVDKDGFHNYLEVNIVGGPVRVYKCKYDPDNFINCYENETSFYMISEFKQVANKIVYACLNGTGFFGNRRTWRKKNKEEQTK